MFEPLAIGNWTLNVDVSDESSTRKTSGAIGVKVARGTSSANVSAPSAITATMYRRPRGGRSLSKAPQVYVVGMATVDDAQRRPRRRS